MITPIARTYSRHNTYDKLGESALRHDIILEFGQTSNVHEIGFTQNRVWMRLGDDGWTRSSFSHLDMVEFQDISERIKFNGVVPAEEGMKEELFDLCEEGSVIMQEWDKKLAYVDKKIDSTRTIVLISLNYHSGKWERHYLSNLSMELTWPLTPRHYLFSVKADIEAIRDLYLSERLYAVGE